MLEGLQYKAVKVLPETELAGTIFIFKTGTSNCQNWGSVNRMEILISLQLKRFTLHLYSFFLSSYKETSIFDLKTGVDVHCDRFMYCRQRSDRFQLL